VRAITTRIDLSISFRARFTDPRSALGEVGQRCAKSELYRGVIYEKFPSSAGRTTSFARGVGGGGDNLNLATEMHCGALQEWRELQR